MIMTLSKISCLNSPNIAGVGMVINLKENASEVTEHKSNDLIIEYALISDALPCFADLRFPNFADCSVLAWNLFTTKIVVKEVSVALNLITG